VWHFRTWDASGFHRQPFDFLLKSGMGPEGVAVRVAVGGVRAALRRASMGYRFVEKKGLIW
jgi:hypothetical protein